MSDLCSADSELRNMRTKALNQHITPRNQKTIGKLSDCRHACLKRRNFSDLLPDNICNDPNLSIRLTTVVICRLCSMRMFCLPNYAIKKKSVNKYMRIWRDRKIYNIIAYNEEKIINVKERDVED